MTTPGARPPRPSTPRDGRDPAIERRRARQAAAELFTVGDLVRAYLSEHAERHQRPRTLIETKRALERHWLPPHSLRSATVSRRDVSARLLELAPQIIRASDEGAVIRSRRGCFLAIPTENVPRKGIKGKRIGPSTFPKHRCPEAIRPRYHIWTASRIAWFEIADHLPRHPESAR